MEPLALPEIPLPPNWNDLSKRGLLAAFTLAHYTLTAVRAWGHSCELPGVRRETHIERLETDLARVKEENRILRARFCKIPPMQRPHYSAADRFAILSLKEASGWSLATTAKQFLLSPQTIAKWTKLFDDDRLVAPPGPVNRFPDYVAALVQLLKQRFPLLGYRAIADWLARAGLHVSATSVRRLLQRPQRRPRPEQRPREQRNSGDGPAVTASRPGQLWHADITTIPTSFGLALSWWPFAFPAVFPFCFKVVVVLDHFSRKVLATRVVRREPSGHDVRRALDDALATAGAPPRHIVSDKGKQFFNAATRKPARVFGAWLEKHGVRPRFGALGQHGSIAVIERFHRTLKSEGTRRMLVPYCAADLQVELDVFADWYNSKRPHSSLAAASPSEVFCGSPPPLQERRIETRPRYPVAPSDVESGKVIRVDDLRLKASAYRGRKHLPDVSLEAA